MVKLVLSMDHLFFKVMGENLYIVFHARFAYLTVVCRDPAVGLMDTAII